MWSASAIGYSTTREPQNTQARWLTEPARLALSQAISAGRLSPVWTTCFSRPGSSSITRPPLPSHRRNYDPLGGDLDECRFVHCRGSNPAVKANDDFIPARSDRSAEAVERRKSPAESRINGRFVAQGRENQRVRFCAIVVGEQFHIIFHTCNPGCRRARPPKYPRP